MSYLFSGPPHPQTTSMDKVDDVDFSRENPFAFNSVVTKLES